MDSVFQVHILNEVGIEKARTIAQKFDELLDYIGTEGFGTREYNIVRTKLEEASFFAKKNMANQPQNQKG